MALGGQGWTERLNGLRRQVGLAKNSFIVSWGSGNPPDHRGVSETPTMEPIGETIIRPSVAREGSGLVRSITLIDDTTIAVFSVPIAAPVPWDGICGPPSSL